ncbi:MAG: Holliday junction resolvase RecU [Cellulosilyticaceae bacterium]
MTSWRNMEGYPDPTACEAVERASKNRKMANKGKGFEDEVNLANKVYHNRGIALVQKISTPWQVIRRGAQIVSAFPTGKSTLDFRGTVKGGMSISFDCKESEDPNGLPLKHIKEHQIEYMRDALEVGENSFLLCFMKSTSMRYFIPGRVVLDYWDAWQQNKGRKGFNTIRIDDMVSIRSRDGVILDYLAPLNIQK